MRTRLLCCGFAWSRQEILGYHAAGQVGRESTFLSCDAPHRRPAAPASDVAPMPHICSTLPTSNLRDVCLLVYSLVARDGCCFSKQSGQSRVNDLGPFYISVLLITHIHQSSTRDADVTASQRQCANGKKHHHRSFRKWWSAVGRLTSTGCREVLPIRCPGRKPNPLLPCRSGGSARLLPCTDLQ